MVPKIYVALCFHNHQPVYRPDISPADTPEIRQYVLGSGDADNRREIYAAADAYAIEQMRGDTTQPNFGLQVSYSGSLIETLDATAAAGHWPGLGWNGRYQDVRANDCTELGNPRLDFVNLGYHHPLMGLIATGHDEAGRVPCDKDLELQLRMHQLIVQKTFGGQVSRGFFPPEMAFTERMIPVAARVGIEWTMVDNIHIDRANIDYDNPHDGLQAPNGADRRNPGTHDYRILPTDLGKTAQVSAGALRPHYARAVDPYTGNETLMIVVPEERALSSFIQKDRDGSKVSLVLERFTDLNTDPAHPLLVLLATDGDNNGSNSAEFHRSVPIDLATRYSGKVVFTTVQDYLDMFPPEKPRETIDAHGIRRYEGGDIIHVEDGAWWGANLGDPQFSKWADDPAWTGYSAKKNSWAVLTAAKNAVLTADAMDPAGLSNASLENIIADRGADIERAWHALLVGQTSCYEYWGPDNVLSYSSVKAANLAVERAHAVIDRHGLGEDRVGPSIFLPMHAPYNPTGSFEVVTYAYDVNGIRSVTLHWRTLDGPPSAVDLTFGAHPWTQGLVMPKMPFPDLDKRPQTWVEPQVRADEYRAKIEVEQHREGVTVQFYIEAEDHVGNVSRSPIRNVHVAPG